MITSKTTKRIVKRSYRSGEKNLSSEDQASIDSETETLKNDIKLNFNSYFQNKPNITLSTSLFLLRVISINFILAFFDIVLAFITEGETILHYFSRNFRIYLANLLFIIGLVGSIFNVIFGSTLIIISLLLILWKIIDLRKSYQL